MRGFYRVCCQRRLTVLINIHYSAKNSYFYFYLSGITDRDIKVKFDTGAGATIITSKALGMNSIQSEHITEYINKKGIEKRVFKSATDTEFCGYLCRCTDVKLNDVLIEKFYFYLVLNDSLNKALLGDDFISYCTFSHQSRSDIYITAIDMNLYALSYGNKIDCINIDEVMI